MIETELRRTPYPKDMKISFRNKYNNGVVTIFSNHDYYITYKPSGNNDFKTVSGSVRIEQDIKVIKVRTSIADEYLTDIAVSSILNAIPMNNNNDQIKCDFTGIQIDDVKLVMTLHLKYLSGEYTIDLTPGGLYEITYVQDIRGTIKMVTVIGKLVSINYPYQTFSAGPHNVSTFSEMAYGRVNCIFLFDCSGEYSSVRIKLDLRDIRGIKEYVQEIPGEEDPEQPLPEIPEGFSYLTTTVDEEQCYVEVIDENGNPAIVYGK